jgi:hypothetical protein
VVFEYEAVRDGRRIHVSHINVKGRTWGYNVEFIAPAGHPPGGPAAPFPGRHRTTTATSIEETLRQGLDLAPGAGFEHVRMSAPSDAALPGIGRPTR